MDKEREKEHRDEAERMRLLPVDVQRELIREHKAIATNPKVPKRDRQFAAERARVLTRLLFGKKRGK
jgi:hypothetical protein